MSQKETLLVNLWDVLKSTEHINLLIRFSIACRAGVVLASEYSVFSRWKLSCCLWFLQQWKGWGEKTNCTKGVSNSQKKGEASLLSTLVLYQTWTGITDCKLVMLTPIKITASQASFSWKETWESYRKSSSKAKKSSKLLTQQVLNQTELTAKEIKHPHQVYCCLYITSYLPLFTWSIQISCQNTVCPQNFWFTFSTKSTTTTTNKLHWAK